MEPAADVDVQVPLVVDVDGTLIKSDLLFEAVLQMAASRVLELWRIPLWLSHGKAALKTAVAAYGDPGIAHIPFREEIVELIRAAQRQGRPVYLASASTPPGPGVTGMPGWYAARQALHDLSGVRIELADLFVE